MEDPKRKLSFKKSQWKRRARRAINHAGVSFNLQRLGAPMEMSDVYDDARHIMELGHAGERLHGEATRLDMEGNVRYDVEHVCRLLETLNSHFFSYVERMGWPTSQFAVYVSAITPTSTGGYSGEEETEAEI